MKRFIIALTAVLTAFCLVLVGCKKEEESSQSKEVSITLDNISITIETDEVQMLRATVENTDEDVVWTSSNTEIATVETTERGGLVLGVAPGNATVTASVGNASATCQVTVTGNSYYPVLTLDKESTSLYEGDSVTVDASVFIGEKESAVTCAWRSANEQIATVDDGVITAVAVGKTVVTASATVNGILLEAEVLVEVKDDVYFVVNEEFLRLAMTAGLNTNEIAEKTLSTTLRIKDEVVQPNIVRWSSSDGEIVSVDEETGLAVSGNKTGVATVTAKYVFEGKSYSATASVETYKSVIDTDIYLSDIDLSKGSFSLPLTSLSSDISALTGEIFFHTENKTASATAENGELTVDATEVAFGEQTARVEFSDRIYVLDGLFVTKILRTAEDLQNLTELAGGRDKNDAYTGYFVLGNNIDLGTVAICAPTDSDDARSPSRGFQGVFDGRGFVIVNGNFTGSGGLFGTIGSLGVVKNVAFINATMNMYAGGLLAQKIFGRVENLLIDASMTGGSGYNGTLAYTSVGATYRNLVVRLSYGSARAVSPTASGNNSVLVTYMPDSESIFNNVYAISDLVYEGSVCVFDANTGNATRYREEGWGLFSAPIGKENALRFTNLPAEYWSVPESGLPCFVKEEGYIASYTVEHYIESKTAEYEFTYAESTSFKSRIGSSVQATPKAYAGYLPNTTLDESVEAGTIVADGSLVLKLYYTVQGKVAIANEDNENAYLSLAGGGYSHIRMIGGFAGKDNVYRVTTTSASPWDTRLEVTGVSNSWLSTKGYTELSFKFYLTPGEADFYLNIYTIDPELGFTHKGFSGGLSAANIASVSEYMQFYDEDGNRVKNVATGAWYTVKAQFVNFDKGDMNRIFAMSNIKIGTYYLTDVSFNKVPFEAYLTGGDENISVALGETKTVTPPALVTGWAGQTGSVAFTFESDDTSVCTVENGVITPVKKGNANITVKCVWKDKEYSASVAVTVLDAVSVTIDETETVLTAFPQADGEVSSKTLGVTVIINGVEVDSPVLSWSSNKTEVVSVNETGLVSAGSRAGVAIVTVTYEHEGVRYTASVEIRCVKLEVEIGSFADVDLSTVWTLDLIDDLNMTEAEAQAVAQAPAVTVGGVEATATLQDGKVEVTFGAGTPFGQIDVQFDFFSHIRLGEGFFVTKIIKTATDLLSMETLAGGRDATTDAYEGYFVLGNSIDLGSTKVSAKQDGNAHQRDITRGFQGVFDGRGHVIANGIYDTGLFGTVGGDGKVVNLAIYNAVLAPSSNGTGIFGYKYFGLLENVSISCTHASTFDNAGTIAYTAYGATFRNVVVETDYVWSRMSSRNNHGAFIAFNATSGHGNSPTGLINTYENVYVITNRLHKGKISVFDEVNTQKYEQKGNGLITYLENAENMSFTGLNSEYWTGEGVPYFKTVDSELTASYTVKHFVRNDTTGLVERETETKRAMVGSVITSYGRGYEDRKLADPNKDSNLTQLFPSGKAGLHTGTVTADNALVLECYYTMRDQYLVSHSTSNKAYVMDMRGNPRTGAQVVDYLGTYEGVEGAYRMTSAAGGDSRIVLRNSIITLSELQSYKYFEVKVYSTNFAAVDVIPQPVSGSGYNVSDLANDSCMELYDETGTTKLTQTPTSGWVTMRFICSKIGNATYYLQIGLKGSGTSYCFAQPKLVA